MVVFVGANKSVGLHPFYVQFGQALLTYDVLLLFIIAIQVYLTLKFRKNVKLHSALIFSTLFGLLPPILSRLLGVVIPALEITSLDTMYRFGYSLQISLLITFIFYPPRNKNEPESN